MRKNIILLMCVQVLSAVMFAQAPQLTVPWNFGFEEKDSLILKDYWHINDGGDTARCKERWVIGTYAHTEGHRSLYISNDEGFSAEFDTTRNTCYAYMDFTLPQGQYELSFDWRCLGGPDSYLCAGVGIAQQMKNMVSDYKLASLTDEVLQFAQAENRVMRGSSKWQNASVQLSSNGVRTYRMYFAWVNQNRNPKLPNRFAAYVDNIQIASRNCAKPSKLEARTSGDSIILSWKGTSEQYCVEYRKYGRDRWSVQTGIQKEELILEGMDEGAYDFRVRGVCNTTDTSAYKYLNTFGVYYPERHCINYINLYDSVNAYATYGTFADPYASVGVVDSTVAGYDAKYWRHVVNWDSEEYDPRTDYRLRVVPEDEVASIRLGNWNVGTEGESMSFFYTVDAENAAILLLKYAVVLEDPNHGENDQPHFTLEILDEYGQMIDLDCGSADFYADSHREGWNTTGGVTWKDWTVIGLNLAEYDGERLTIRLTTRDCNWGGHYGYAYFTVGCAAARITGTSCGDDAQMSIQAPNGFAYEWFDKYDQPVPESMLSNRGQTLLLEPSDTTTYRCHLTYLEETSCGFDLYSNCLPRYPVADFEWSYEPTECQNKVRFKNKSHIMTIFNNVVEYHHDQPCDEYDWDFMNGQQASDKNPVVVFPNAGGRFAVTLASYIAEGRCMDDTVIYVDIPSIGDTAVYMDTTICEGNYVMLGPKFCGMDSTYDYTWQTVAGCDSTVYMRVHLNPVTDEFVGDTTVCAETPLVVDGISYKMFPESGKFYRFYTNQYGCDSTVWMNVTVKDSIKPEVRVSDLDSQSGINSGEIELSGSGYDYYVVNGEKNGNLKNLQSGIYQLEFFNDFGCSIDSTFIIGFDSLTLSAEKLIEVCGDETEVDIPFVSKGTPVSATMRFHYMMWFDEKAQTAGFASDTVFADMPSEEDWFRVPIPTGVQPGYYTVYFEATNELGDPQRVSVVLQIDYSKDVVFQRWGDVLSVVKPEILGDSIMSFQWMKDGLEIEGATKSYYYEEDGLDENAIYKVKLIMSDSTVLYTCDVEAIASPASVQVYPTILTGGGSVEIRVPSAGSMTCYTSTGLVVDQTQLQEGMNTWKAPQMTGVYVLVITIGEETRNFRICVNN